MSTHRRTWQKSEQRITAMFGCRRNPGSGSQGRSDLTRSDSTHETLFIEAKMREKHATRTLYDATKALAVKEKKTPVLVLADKGRPGCLIVAHSDDFRAVAVEYLAANYDPETCNEIIAAQKRLKGVDDGDF